MSPEFDEAVVRFGNALTEMLNIDAADALAIVTGTAVVVTLEEFRRAGVDISTEINITNVLVGGGAFRDVTIHAAKAEAPGAGS